MRAARSPPNSPSRAWLCSMRRFRAVRSRWRRATPRSWSAATRRPSSASSRGCAPKVTYIGASGLAVQMKIAVNLLLMVEVIAFGEAVALAEKGGVAREIAVDAILKSVAASPVLAYRGPFILDGKMPAIPLADV